MIQNGIICSIHVFLIKGRCTFNHVLRLTTVKTDISQLILVKKTVRPLTWSWHVNISLSNATTLCQLQWDEYLEQNGFKAYSSKTTSMQLEIDLENSK